MMDMSKTGEFTSHKVAKRKMKEKEPTKEEIARLKKSGRAKRERFEKAMAGDEDAIMECLYGLGGCTKETLDRYYEIKKWCEDD